MDVKVNAIVLRAADYGENDKILTLLTRELGKITAGIKGVKKAGAKLKFAAQPFCFGEYTLAKRGERYTVTGCTEAESFYDLRCDILKFYAASSAAEATLSLTYDGEECGDIFVAILNTYAQMCTGDEGLELVKFLLFLLDCAGYAVSAENCPHCGGSLLGVEKLRFDFNFGSFTCANCSEGAGASRTTFELVRAIKEGATPECTQDAKKRVLRLIREYFAFKTEGKLKALSEYIRLL